MNVFAISYGKNLFADGPERSRQKMCAEVVTSFHLLVFADSRQYSDRQEGNFFVYASGGRRHLGLLIAAIVRGWRILRLAAASKQDWVITTQDPFESGLVGYVLSKIFGLRLVVQEHGDFFSTPHWRRESKLNYVRYKFGKWLLTRADTVRVVEDRMVNIMINLGVAPKRIKVLSVAIPIDRFLAKTPALHTDGGEVTILTVARFVSQKNITLLLQAFARIQADIPLARLLIVGAGPQESLLKKAVGELAIPSARVSWLPWSDDVPSLMARSHIYSLSSNYEGYARVIPEAMACGLPIVMTDVGCAGHVCQSRVHGVVVPVGDAEAFAEALLLLVSDIRLRQQYGRDARRDVVDKLLPLSAYPTAWRATLSVNL